MLFEIVGFLSGVAGIGAAFWLMHRHESSRVLDRFYGGPGGGQRA